MVSGVGGWEGVDVAPAPAVLDLVASASSNAYLSTRPLATLEKAGKSSEVAMIIVGISFSRLKARAHSGRTAKEEERERAAGNITKDEGGEEGWWLRSLSKQRGRRDGS